MTIGERQRAGCVRIVRHTGDLEPRTAVTRCFRGSADGRLIVDDVHSKITGTLFDIIPHVTNPLSCASNTAYAKGDGNIREVKLYSMSSAVGRFQR